LEARIADGVRYSTFQKEAAALAKFENALNLFAQKTGSGLTYDFRSSMEAPRKEAAQVLEKFQETRAYTNPVKLIKNISNDNYKLIAQLQHEGGARLYEASLIHEDQLEGLGKDPPTGKEVGLVRLDPADTKGGKRRMISVSPGAYKRLEGHILKHSGEFRIKRADSYRKALMEAARKSNQEYTGSHGLRWNFAQERFQELQKSGYTYEQCLAQTSWDMGHERVDITLHYL